MWQDNLNKHNREWGSKKGKHYIKKKYSNPFFSEKKKKNFFVSRFFENSRFNFSALKVKLFAVGFFLLILAAAWFLIFSNYFQINNITASGQGRIPEDSIQKIAWDYVNKPVFLRPGKNLILLDKEKLKIAIEEKYAFNDIQIIKEYPSAIQIRFMEKEYAYIWKERDLYFYIDAAGYIIKEIDALEVETKNYPLIFNNSSNYIDHNRIGIERKYIDIAPSVLENLNDKEGIVVSNLIIDQDIDTIKADLHEGPVVFFNIESSLEKQINKLFTLKNERLKNDFDSKEYIDVRYGDSIYFR